MLRWGLYIGIVGLAISANAQNPELVLPVGHNRAVIKTLFSKDGSKVFSASNDHTVKCWDVATGRLLRTYDGHLYEIVDFDLSPNGKLMATASRDKTIRIWDIYTGKCLHILKGHTHVVDHVIFNSIGSELISNSWDLTTKIWDVVNGELLESIDAVSIKRTFYGPNDSDLLLITYLNDVLNMVKTPEGVSAFRVVKHQKRIAEARFIHQYNFILTASQDSTIVISKAHKNEELVYKYKCNYPIGEIAISADEKYLMVMAEQIPFAELFLFDSVFTKLKSIGELNPNYSQTIKGVFSSDSKKLLLAMDKDSNAYLMDLTDTGVLTQVIYTRKSGSIKHLNYAPAEDKFIIANDDWNDTLMLYIHENNGIREKPLHGYTTQPHWAASVLHDSFTLSVLDGGEIVLWNNFNNQPVYHFNESEGHVYDVYLTPDQHAYAAYYRDKSVKLFETSTGKLIRVLVDPDPNTYPDGVQVQPTFLDLGVVKPKCVIAHNFVHSMFGFNTLKFSPNGDLFVTASNQIDGLAVWNVKTGILLMNIFIGVEGITQVEFSSDSKQLLIGGIQGALVVFNLETLKWKAYSGHTRSISSAVFLSAVTFASTAGNGEICFWRVNKSKPNQKFNTNNYTQIKYYSEANHTLYVGTDHVLRIFNTQLFTLQNIFKFEDGFSIESIEKTISEDHLMVKFNFNYDKKTPPCLFNLKTKSVYGYYNEQLAQSFEYNGKWIITGRDNFVTRWNAMTNVLLSSFISVNGNGYFTKIANGYYASSPDAAKRLHYVTPELKVITFEQLDVKYNRPDLVLSALGNPDTNLIHSYKLAYQKRIKKLGIDTLQFTPGFGVPEADFVNRDSIGYTQSNSAIKLQLKGLDTANILDRFNIWVNEVPLYGQRGISLRQRNTHALDTTLQIELMQGENKIETSVLNINGTESYRMPLQVKYQPDKKIAGKVHFIGLGIDRFANTQYNLNYSTKDIRDLATALAKRYGDTLQIDTLFNADITKENLQKIKQKLLKGSIYDKVIVVYSGHGILSKEFDYYLSTYSVDFEHPEKNGLPYETLENLLDSIPARQKLMLIDACHSGEVDMDDLVRIKAEAKELGLKGVDVVEYEGAESGLGLQNSFELMQELFVNVGKGTGATVISASAGTQFALENGNLKNGVFTYSILEAMKNNPSITVSQLKTIVGNRVVELTNGMQKPTSRNETIYSDWRVW